jgi:hypothetical protein
MDSQCIIFMDYMRKARSVSNANCYFNARLQTPALNCRTNVDIIIITGETCVDLMKLVHYCAD